MSQMGFSIQGEVSSGAPFTVEWLQMGPDAGMSAWSLGMGGAGGVRPGAQYFFPLRLPAPQKSFLFFSIFLLSPSQDSQPTLFLVQALPCRCSQFYQSPI